MFSIRVDGLGKAYNIYAKPIDSFKEWLLRRPYHETFWALSDVNFSILRGKSLGVIGENGAGKSTLLKLIAGTIDPTCGKIERNGRISAILELGSGFHPELSGKENIRIGCAVLGLSPAETEQRLPEIIAFSELEKFIDRPIKTYSTGMYIRLAFSVVTSVDPDILVVDEALSVGDQHFQKKSIDRMLAFRDQGKTLIFCSHTLYYIQKVCDTCLWLRNGKPEMLGPTQEVTECYQDYERSLDAETAPAASQTTKKLFKTKKSGDKTYLLEVSLRGTSQDGVIDTGKTLTARVVACLGPEAKAEGTHLGLIIVRNDMTWCYGVSTEMEGSMMYPLAEDKCGVNFVLEELSLLAGQYNMEVYLLDSSGMHIYDVWKENAPFTVRQSTKEAGIARLPHRWEKP
ncbi:ABC transporter ATP-binding protein [Acidobacteriota bacterium]